MPNGDLLDEFDSLHCPEGFNQFFERIDHHCRQHGKEAAVAMESYNGYTRPLDSLVKVRCYQLYNINNLKLARFKKIIPAAAKNDCIDCKGLELFQLRDHLPLAKDVLQEIMPTPHELKKLSRRRLSTLNNISSVGHKYAAIIKSWQPNALFSHEVEWVSEMIIADAQRILALKDDIKALTLRCETLIDGIPGPHGQIAPVLLEVFDFLMSLRSICRLKPRRVNNRPQMKKSTNNCRNNQYHEEIINANNRKK